MRLKWPLVVLLYYIQGIEANFVLCQSNSCFFTAVHVYMALLFIWVLILDMFKLS